MSINETVRGACVTSSVPAPVSARDGRLVRRALNGQFAEAALKYVVQKSFSLRVRKTDGTAKMMAGITGGARIGRIIKLPIGKDDVV